MLIVIALRVEGVALLVCPDRRIVDGPDNPVAGGNRNRAAACWKSAACAYFLPVRYVLLVGAGGSGPVRDVHTELPTHLG